MFPLIFFLISFLAAINAVILDSVFGAYGIFAALGIFSAAFVVDFASTISVKNAKDLEMNIVVKRLGNYLNFYLSLILIGVISAIVQVAVYFIFDVTVVSYFISSLHLYAILSNLQHKKLRLKIKKNTVCDEPNNNR